MTPFFSLEELNASNAEMPAFYQRVEKSGDDRSYVILTALMLENQYDQFLSILIPGFNALADNRDFTFSLKTQLLRALKLIPPLIPRCADCIRQIRNDFAHRLELEKIEDVKVEYLHRANRLYNEIYAPYKQTHDGKIAREVFHGLAFGAMFGLRAYRPNITAMRNRIDNPAFAMELQAVTDHAFFSILKAEDPQK